MLRLSSVPYNFVLTLSVIPQTSSSFSQAYEPSQLCGLGTLILVPRRRREESNPLIHAMLPAHDLSLGKWTSVTNRVIPLERLVIQGCCPTRIGGEYRVHNNTRMAFPQGAVDAQTDIIQFFYSFTGEVRRHYQVNHNI